MTEQIQIPNAELISLNLLKVDNENPNRMTKEQQERLATSIKKWGFIVPIITNKDLLIADGEQRFQVAKTLGMTEVSVIRLPVEDVDRRLLRQVLNKLRGEHELVADALEFEKIIQANREDDLKYLLDLNDSKLERYLREIHPPKDEDYEIPEIEKVKTNIKCGDIIQLGKHRLMCGDSTNSKEVGILGGGARCDLLFTDPPYGMGKDFANDDNLDVQTFHSKWMQNGKTDASLIWYDPKKLDQIIIPALKYRGRMCDYLHLYKPNDVAFPLHSWIRTSESMCIFGKPQFEDVHPFAHDTYIWNHTGKDHSFYHPAVKPLEVVKDVIQRFNAPIILDLFGGSGTTLIACEQTGRICYMMEIDPRYCEIICQRWEKYTGQKRKLVKSGKNDVQQNGNSTNS